MGNELLKPKPIEIKPAVPGQEILMGFLYEQDGLDDAQLIQIVEGSKKDFDEIAEDKRSIWFAFETDRPVGVVQLLHTSIQEEFEGDSATAELHHLKVVTKYQGKGISSRLKATAEQEAISRGYSQIILEVNMNNYYAIDIYNRWGYSTVRENVTQDYVSYIMAKELA